MVMKELNIWNNQFDSGTYNYSTNSYTVVNLVYLDNLNVF